VENSKRKKLRTEADLLQDLFESFPLIKSIRKQKGYEEEREFRGGGGRKKENFSTFPGGEGQVPGVILTFQKKGPYETGNPMGIWRRGGGGLVLEKGWKAKRDGKMNTQ